MKDNIDRHMNVTPTHVGSNGLRYNIHFAFTIPNVLTTNSTQPFTPLYPVHTNIFSFQ
jgi:hypothetical protein